MSKRNTPQRRHNILALLNEQGEVSVDELAKRFETSEVTIRKDLAALESHGLLLRRYGGAITMPQELVAEPGQSVSKYKQAIARAAVKRIREHARIIIDSGSTTAAMIPELGQQPGLVVMTNSLHVANALSELEHEPVLLMTGGTWDPHSESFQGQVAEQVLRSYDFDQLFIGADGIDLVRGTTTFNELLGLSRVMAEVAREVIVMVEADKIGRKIPTWSCRGAASIPSLPMIACHRGPRSDSGPRYHRDLRGCQSGEISMCGIVGAVAERNITAILLEGLKRLEYRGYDSAGVAVFTNDAKLERMRRPGKVSELETALAEQPLAGRLGIAHTRWATHGAPCERNAHPHFSGDIAVVHNGIIENHEALREQLKALGYVFTSDTDTEVIAHLLSHKLKDQPDLTVALKATVKELHGAYGLAVINAQQPDRLVAARSGSPLVIGLGLGENFLASDQLALRQVTDRFMYLEEGDIAEIRRDTVQIWDVNGNAVERQTVQYSDGAEAADKGEFRHYMLKEIHEQPSVVQRTLEGRLSNNQVLVQAFGPQAAELFAKVRNVQIVACGTSYHAGMVARYWLEELAGIRARSKSPANSATAR